MKKYQNETARRQIRDSAIVRDAIARKIDTPFSLPIHRAHRRDAAASIIVSDPLDASSILCRRLRYLVIVFMLVFLRWRLCRRRRFLGPVVKPPPPLSLSPIPLTCCLFLVLRQRLHHRCWFLGPVFLRRCHRRCRQFPGPINTPPPPPSETFSQEHRIFCFIRQRLRRNCLVLGIVFLCRRLSSFSPITQARHRDATASVVVPGSSPPLLLSPIPHTRRLFLVLLWCLRCYCQFRGPVSKKLLTFRLLTSYFVWWRFALVTVGSASLPYLVRYRYGWKEFRCKLNTQIIYKKYTILWFEFDLCGLQHQKDRDKSFEVSQ